MTLIRLNIYLTAIVVLKIKILDNIMFQLIKYNASLCIYPAVHRIDKMWSMLTSYENASQTFVHQQ